MKRKIVICDTCKKDITYEDRRFKFKKYTSDYSNFDDWECNKWSRCDMCEDCYEQLLVFINGKVSENMNELILTPCQKRYFSK